MKTLLNIALAAAVIGGTALAGAAPAAAEDGHDRDGWHADARGDRDDWRGRDHDWRGDRGDWRGVRYGYRRCYTRSEWSWYWHRYVRVNRCY
jgi:hypothetical protein